MKTAASSEALDEEVSGALKWLKRHSTQATLEGMARYAIPSEHALGVAMRDIKALGKQLGKTRNLPLLSGRPVFTKRGC